MMKIKNAMLCWNYETKKIGVLEHPPGTETWRNSGFTSDVGAKVHGVWCKMNEWERILAFITEGIWLIRNEGFDSEEVFKVLEEVDECRIVMQKDPFSS